MGRRLLLGAAGIAGLAALAGRAKADPPTPPPAGPISKTYKTLQQVFDKLGKGDETTPAQPACPIESLPEDVDAQYVVSMPGKYHFTRNLVQSPVKPVCVKITCDDVVIAGNGFVVQGASVSPQSSSVFRTVGSRRNLDVSDLSFSRVSGLCFECETCDDLCVSDVTFVECVGRASAASTDLMVARDRLEMDDVLLTGCTGRISSRKSTRMVDMSITHSDASGIFCEERAEIEGVTMSSCTQSSIRMGDSSSADWVIIWHTSVASGGGLSCGDGCYLQRVQLNDVTGPGGGGSGVVMGVSCTMIELVVVIAVLARVVQCGDGCDLDGVSMSSVTGNGVEGGSKLRYHEWRWRNSAGTAVTCLHSCTIDEFEMCDSMGDGVVCGDQCDVSRGVVTGCGGGNAMRGGSSCSFECVCVCNHAFTAVIMGGDRTRLCDSSFSLCSDGVALLGAHATVDGCEVLGGGSGGGAGTPPTVAFNVGHGSTCTCTCASGYLGSAMVCGDRCLAEGVFVEGGTTAITCGNNCRAKRCEVKLSLGSAISGGRSFVVEECEVSGGGGGGGGVIKVAISGGQGSCVDACVVADFDGDAVSCHEESSVTDSMMSSCTGRASLTKPRSNISNNRVVNTQGIVLEAATECYCNSIDTSSGPAITVQGECCYVTENECTSEADGGGGIVLHGATPTTSSSDGTVVSSNRILPKITTFQPPPAIMPDALTVAPGVTGCFIECNCMHLRTAAGNPSPGPGLWSGRRLPGGPGSCNAYAPFVDVTCADDISTLPAPSQQGHPRANIIY